MKRFIVGNTYSCKSICDQGCIFKYFVSWRTKKTVELRDENGKVIKKKIFMDIKNREYCKPQGNYSMAPILRA